MPKATIVCNTEGAEIRYTTNGTDVLETSPLYEDEIDIEAGGTIKAKAFKIAMNPSNQVELQSFPKLQTPTVSVSRSEETVTISIGNTVSGATYRYKVGSAPSSPTDGSPISSSTDMNDAGALTVYVRGWYKGQYNPSDSASGSVSAYKPKLKTPTLSLSRNGSAVNGTIGNTVSGATYRYKVGSAPASDSDGTPISGNTFSFTNSNAVTVYVKGFKSGYNPSSSVSANVAGRYPSPGQKLPTPVVSMSTLDFGDYQVIRFTFNNNSDYSSYDDNPDANIQYDIYQGDPAFYDESVNIGTEHYDIKWSNWSSGQPDVSIYAIDNSDIYTESDRVKFSKESIIESMDKTMGG